jgi:hypothetical protein
MTETGCKQCGENTFSGDRASSCTSCPDGMHSAAGSTFCSPDDEEGPDDLLTPGKLCVSNFIYFLRTVNVPENTSGFPVDRLFCLID